MKLNHEPDKCVTESNTLLIAINESLSSKLGELKLVDADINLAEPGAKILRALPVNE